VAKKRRQARSPQVLKRNGAKVETHDISVGGIVVGNVEHKTGGQKPWQANSVVARHGSVIQVQESFPTKDEAIESVIRRYQTKPKKRTVPLRKSLARNQDLGAVKRRVMR
jgi:hypothetical protein